MKYTKQQIEGNVLELILEKANHSVKPLEENLMYWITTDPEKYADIIKLTVGIMQQTREEILAKYGVKSQKFGEIEYKENSTQEEELWNRVAEAFRQWSYQWDYYMMTNKNKPISIEQLVFHLSQLYKISSK